MKNKLLLFLFSLISLYLIFYLGRLYEFRQNQEAINTFINTTTFNQTTNQNYFDNSDIDKLLDNFKLDH